MPNLPFSPVPPSGSLPVADLSGDAFDPARETVIGGVVTAAGRPLAGVPVRLWNADGRFTAEVATSAQGAFRLFAGPGRWTLSAPGAAGQQTVTAHLGTAAALAIVVDAGADRAA